MGNSSLLQRLTRGHPGWDVGDQLISLVKSLDFDYIVCEHLGNFYASGCRLSFSDLRDGVVFPSWLPSYVLALYGMKADYWEMAGGYADSFHGTPARRGGVFSPAGNDQELGFPLFDVPVGVYDFQSNSSGAACNASSAQWLCSAHRWDTKTGSGSPHAAIPQFPV
jgi:hypothetical protein